MAWCRLDIPKSLSAFERQRVVQILGFGLGAKVLGNPYPLGGYSGVELGVSNEMIPTSDLASFTNKSALQGETSFLQLTAAKGLYYNFDFFINFIPMGQNEGMSGFGGGLRWGVFEGEYLPVTLSIQSAGSLVSFQDKINFSTQTIDGIVSFIVEDVTLYAAIGTIRSAGSFVGGPTGVTVTDSGKTEHEISTDTRFLTGVSVNFSKLFLAAELSKVNDAVYAAKLGVRF